MRYHNVGTGYGDTATGTYALYSNTTGYSNTTIGDSALYSNTASGAFALNSNTTGNFNTATGAGALDNNSTGGRNTATGDGALFDNTTGIVNTATGSDALASNTTGDYNTASGASALTNNTTGDFNTATGSQALYSNTTGVHNVSTGLAALYSNTTGHDNAATGYQALYSNTTGANNIALGSFAGSGVTNGDGNIDIGNTGGPGDVTTIRIGTSQTKCFIAGIFNVPTPGTFTSLPVYIDSTGQLTAKGSSLRFKHNIKPMDSISEGILSFKPVTFHYKGDQTNTAQFGLIAEEVEKVNPDLVVRDKDGQIYSVRYDEVNAMLLNEFLKEHRKAKEERYKVDQLEKQIEVLTAGLLKVTAELALSKPARKTVRDQ